MSKDPSIPMRNKVNWHHVRDDHMFSIIKLVCRHQNTQQFGALLPIDLINEEIRNSNAYKEYYAVDTRAAPPKPKASVRKTRSSSDITVTPPTTAAGTSSIPRVPYVPTNESEKELSWNSTDEEADDEGKDDDGDKGKDDDDDGEEREGDDDDDDDDNGEEEYNEETRDKESFDPIQKTLKNSDDEGNGEEDLGLNVGRKEGHDEEKRRMNYTKTSTLIKEGISTASSQFVTSMLNLTLDVGMESIFETTSQMDVHTTTFVALLPMSAPTMTPSIIATITTTSQAPILPTIALSTIIQDLPNFGSLFGFDDRLRTLEAKILNSCKRISLLEQSLPFSRSENDVFLKTIDENMQKIIKEQVKEQVKASASESALAEEPMQTTFQIEEPSHLESDTELEYHLEDVFKATTNHMDWVNPKGQQYPHNLLKPLPLIPNNRGRRVIPFEHFINNDLEYLRRGNISMEVKVPGSAVSQIHNHMLIPDYQVKVQVSKILPKIEQTVYEQLEAKVLTRLSNSSKTSYAVAADLSEMELKKILIEKWKAISPSIDLMSKGIFTRLFLVELEFHLEELYKATTDQLDWINPKGQQYLHNLLKHLPMIPNSRGRRVIPFDHFINNDLEYLLGELEYHLEEVYKATTDQLDWVNPEGQQYPHNLIQPLRLIPNNQGRRVIPFAHFINNDLEYLRGGASSRKYTTFVTKTKAADYGNIKWIEDLKRQQFYGFTVNWESALDVYSKRRIIVVTNLKIVEWHSYKHLDCITVRRDDDKLYKFKEGDFKRLHLQDIKDILLLLVQGKLFNLTIEERFAFNVSLRMFTRSIAIQRRVKDLQLGVESYQKRLNLTKPDTYRSDLKLWEAYTAYSNPRGFIYQNKDKKNRLMRIDELHQFSDGTLNDVRNALDNRLKGIRMQFLP
nr:hypothetical protein [Tanacetum cinerariifolium]